MSFRQSVPFTFILCVAGLSFAGTVAVAAFAQPVVNPQTAPQVQFVTADELKAVLAKNKPVTVIDVRATNDLGQSKIKGAIHVKLRRLQARLALPPLNNIPRNGEVVTYCACPNDEASIRAAQILSDAGFKHVRALKGGWVAWKKTDGQVEPRPRGL